MTRKIIASTFLLVVVVLFFALKKPERQRLDLRSQEVGIATGETKTNPLPGSPSDDRKLQDNAGDFLVSTNRSEISSAAADALIAQYHNSTKALDRIELIKMMGFCRHEKIVTLLTNELLAEIKPSWLNSGEIQDIRNVYDRVIDSLGFQAQRSDVAFNFLRSSIDPDFWQDSAAWFDDVIRSLCCSGSFRALGISGREEARKILQQVKVSGKTTYYFKSDSKVKRNLVNAILFSAYILDQIEERGKQEFQDGFYKTPWVENYTLWTQSQKGKPWIEWKEQKR